MLVRFGAVQLFVRIVEQFVGDRAALLDLLLADVLAAMVDMAHATLVHCVGLIGSVLDWSRAADALHDFDRGGG